MFFYRITTWTGAVGEAAWTFFVLFFGACLVYLPVDPDPAHQELLSLATGALVGLVVGGDLVWTINRVEGLRPSGRSRVIGALLAVPAAVIFRWAEVADTENSWVFGSVWTLPVPSLVMWLVLFLAGLAVVN